jgi:uncharacterized protein (TIGR02118 family)
MIRVLAFIRRLPGVSRDAFRTHYEEIHVPIALPFLTGTSGYVRHHIREELYGKADFDCMTRFEYPDAAVVRAVFERIEGPQAEAIRRDERTFMDKPAIVFFPVEEASANGRQPARASEARSEPKASEVHSGRPKASEVHEAGRQPAEGLRLLVCARRPPAEDASRFRARFLEDHLPALRAALLLPHATRPQLALPGAAQSRGFDAVVEIAAAGAGEIASWARALEAEGAQVIAAGVSVHETRMAG